ncbi:MAG: ABC transporter permease [Gammaproteobacteria bacterium]|nr:ABC transporter permease [Gammaproteobacteria bacterium]
MRVSNVFNLGIKELRGLMRDPLMLVLVVYVFTIAVYSSATAMPETLHMAPIAIVDEDQSTLSQRIFDAFYPPNFTPPERVTPAQMDAGMDEGRYTFGLTIPPGFERDVLAGQSPALQLNVDATRMSQAFTGNGYIQAILVGEVNAFVQRNREVDGLPVELALRARFNPELNKSWFGGLTSIISQVTMLSIILTGAALIREREHGTIEHLLAMPVTPVEIMSGKVWSMALVVLTGAAASLVFVVQGALSIPVQGSVPLFLAGAALHVYATTSMGIFLATVARSMPQFGLLIMLAITPLQILSGAVTPRESMPDFVQAIMLATPNTHFVMIAQAVLFRGVGFAMIWPQFLALAIIGSALFAFSLTRFRKMLAAAG